jgi:O-antigen ligase
MTAWQPALTGVFFNTNHYGYYLVIVLLLSAGMFINFSGWKRFAYAFAIIANTITLSFNDSFGPWLAIVCALFVQMVLYYFKDREKFLFSVVVFGLFIGVTAITSFWTLNVFHSIIKFIHDIFLVSSNSPKAGTAGSSRWMIWSGTIKMIKQKPIFGWGMEAITRFGKVQEVGYDRPHNEYLQYALFYGIPAAILYIIGCLSVLTKGFKGRNRDGLAYTCLIASVGYMLSAFFGNTMFYTTPYFFICLGLTFSLSFNNSIN